MPAAAMLQSRAVPRAIASVVTFPTPLADVARVPDVARVSTVCSTCALRTICMPCGLQPESLADIDGLVYSRRRIHRGEHLFHAGEPFKALYAFRSGFFKTYVDAPDGTTQITAFPMAGDVVGMDGIDTDQHRFNVVALDDGDVCVIPYAHLQTVAAGNPTLQRQLHKLMSREIVREQSLMMLLGSMRADARVAAFLLGLSNRFAARGYSASEFNLRMTREEIGSYLGLKLETVSRALSRFQDENLIRAHLRSITIVDAEALQRVVPAF
jgi:CRP/FNR family transcriptional regulator, anaerobic regulatory protein